MPVTVVRELDVVCAELLQFGEAAKQRERGIGYRLAAEGELPDRREASEHAEIRFGESIALHVRLGDSNAGVGDLGAELPVVVGDGSCDAGGDKNAKNQRGQRAESQGREMYRRS